MKKIILIIMIILLSIIAYSTITKGYSIGNLEVLSVNKIKSINEQLESEIVATERLKSETFKQKMSDLNSASKQLLKEKASYQEQIAYSKEADIEKAMQTQKYDVEVLWTKIGMYATKNGVQLKFDILQKNEDKSKRLKLCDLKFTATGTYISLTDFIADLERDAKLSFTIEGFTLVPGASQRNLQATFKVTDIAINSNTTSSANVNTTNTNEKNTDTGSADSKAKQ